MTRSCVVYRLEKADFIRRFRFTFCCLSDCFSVSLLIGKRVVDDPVPHPKLEAMKGIHSVFCLWDFRMRAF